MGQAFKVGSLRETDMHKEIDRLIAISKLGLDHRTVINDIAQYTFNGVANEFFWKCRFPKGRVFQADGMSHEMEKYRKDPEAWALFKPLAEQYLDLVENHPPFTDVMEIIGLSSTRLCKTLGQFLTPSKVAYGASKFIEMPDLSNGEHVSVGDIGGCGSGSMLLGWLRHAYEVHPTRLNQVHLQAVDIDPNMVKLTAVQIAMSSLYHGVALGSLKLHTAHAIIDYEDYAFNGTRTLSAFFTSDWDEYQRYHERERQESLKAA